jgi:transcriptional regulator with XRE-family HTH domain
LLFRRVNLNTPNFYYMDRNEKAMLKFGQHVAELRLQKNLSVRELASRSGMDQRQIDRIEAGKVNILFTTILALARGLGITPEELLESL